MMSDQTTKHEEASRDSSLSDELITSKTEFAIKYLEDHTVPFLSPLSPAWATNSATYNLRVPVTPALIVYARTPKHVQDTVTCALSAGLKVNARGGGHSYTSLGLGGENNHLVVDLTNMNNISVDADTNIATVGAGARLGDVARQLFDNGGRAISHGSCPAVGVSGHILHGGYGWASHSHGLTLDWMVGANVVLADARHVHCSQNENPDLFWALRGAGSNFGIATSYELATFPAPAVSVPFKVSLAWDTEAEKIDGVTALVEFARDMPADLNMRLIMHDSGGHGLDGVYYGATTELCKSLSPLLEKVGGVLTTHPGTWIQGLEHYAERNCLTPITNEHGKFFATSLTLKDLRDEALVSFVRYWHNTAISFNEGGWFALLDIHGGTNSAVSAVPNSATAYAHRDKLLLVQFMHFTGNDCAYPSGGVGLMRDWVQAITAKLHEGDYGMYINYSDSQVDRGTAQRLYWGENLDRLRLLKDKFDPTELFYYPQSIEPASSG
ncbi:glucooligosaccharide oxidase [Diaporthe helianthi]|uniref:Glucooligosaccharide oxidase n=1 Tax=Diaporthe helianthi TaxID=158607 RepID=A0A2P5HR78_DIAHE|nr:glucooligosaccharide oxidase [Diaporthe helianthi]